MKNRNKNQNHSQRRAAVLAFIIFIAMALATVAWLEFLDYRSGKYSLIFSKIIPLQTAQATGKKFDREWTETLARHRVGYDFFKDKAGIIHFKLSVADPDYFPLSKDLHLLVQKYRGSFQLSEVQGMKEQTVYLYQVRFDKRLTHIILLTRRLAGIPVAAPIESPGDAPPKKRLSATPRLAFIIDDIGYADSLAGRLGELGIPLTAAIIPSAPYARSEAEKIHGCGLETIIHLPMQSKNPGNHHPRDQFVLSDSSPAEIEALLRNARAIVPHARGLNNHMGSRITGDPEPMRRVLEAVKAAGLFFVDSKTTNDSVGFALARKMNIRTVIRDVFLDDEQSVEYSSGQIRRLLELARKNGRAVAIGHPFPSTLEALRAAIPWLKQQKVEIVFVSDLLE
ncbi:MAG TPA: divergent polysaccharide deacetylase family protein [Candidatus Binatia bacterium]|nr:divergent polysaccharide deacetylase family protein [Candidatus Binatia bacterium]